MRAPLLRRALWLLGATIVYNVAEGVVAVWFGEKAGSTSLVAFGIDSGIECAASTVLLWRTAVQMRGADEERTEAAERRARRFIGLTFFALSAYVAVEAVLTLWDREAPETSPVGIVLTIISILVMPALSWLKLRTARRIGSRALEAEAKETVACSWLSAITLGGLGLNAALGWWWADPVAGLAMIPWLVREGLEAWTGEDECCG
jgi:divalent metal cation (Fe/Co/Zn/Cd) transporter